MDSSQCQWNLDSGFQTLVEFRIPQPKMSRVLESGFSYMELHCMGRISTEAAVSIIHVHTLLAYNFLLFVIGNRMISRAI